MKDKLAKFKAEYQESKSISDNMLSSQEKLAFEIIEEMEKLIEEQHKANIAGLTAIGDYGTMKTLDFNSYIGKEGTTKQVMYFLASLKDRNTSVDKQLETAFYTLQKVVNDKINKLT